MPQNFRPDEDFAHELDRRDPLRAEREGFLIPSVAAISHGKPDDGGERCVYLTGNSLGLQPRGVKTAIDAELEDWARLGVEGHTEARNPWLSYHALFREMGARLVGGVPGEVVMMNSLTVNLHLLMVSFYRPTRDGRGGGRYKIVIEDAAFPSDSYAVATQAAYHGFDPREAVVRLRPREGEECLRTEDVIGAIEREGDTVALVMLGGVNYRTGQWFDMGAITEAGHRAGAVVGWDLAHAAGNVPLRLHDWGVDFAAWCSYKYLNSGPGAIAGAFVHERHFGRLRRPEEWGLDGGAGGALPVFAGWWGNSEATRFKMGPEFVPVRSAEAWQLSNPPIFAMTPLKVSLEVFDRVGMGALREKSLALTGYMERLLRERLGERARILTPREPERRGCQLSIAVEGSGRETLRALRERGVVCDFREPNVVRAAPVPLYNSFHDVWRFVGALGEVV